MLNHRTVKLHLFFLGFATLYVVLQFFIRFPVSTAFKILPIMVLMAIAACATLPPWSKKNLLIAIGLSALGDVALTLPLRLQLELGLGFFVLAHCAYSILFVRTIASADKPLWLPLWRSSLFIVLPLISAGVFYSLYPYLGPMFLPVCLYILVLTAMSLTAVLISSMVTLGAMIFMLSDSLIAWSEFVYPNFNAAASIMITYYLAQWLIVYGFVLYHKETQ